LEKRTPLLPKPDLATGLKAAWLGLVSILLGPFALWFVLFAKLRRRNLLKPDPLRNVFLISGFLGFMVFLFVVPVHWSLVLGLYVLASLWTAWRMLRPDRLALFRLGPPGRRTDQNPSVAERAEALRFDSLQQCLLAAAMAIYPLVYILALLHNIGELDNFSIHLPSDVYTDGLLWMLYTTPLVGLAGLAAWKASVRPGLRVLIFFYGSILVVLAWIMVWERFDLFLAAQLQGSDRDALFFAFRMEQKWRAGVKAFFYGSAFLLGIGYLIGSPKTGVFAKRAVFLGMPSMLLYAHMLFALGDWNHYLAGFRERSFEAHSYGAYRFAAGAELARTPAAYAAPKLLEEWAELEYQSGYREKAISLLRKCVRLCHGKAYYAKQRKRAERSLDFLARAPEGKAVQLEMPVIKPASYLDQEWYALLSAVAFLKPAWTDLDLKKRLLELSNTVQLHLPKLDNVPELVPALRQLELPVSICFLTSDRIRTALEAGHVPFLSLYGHWVPVSGYDPGRDGFYYYSYGAAPGVDWFRNEDTDLFYHRQGEAFGGEAEKRKSREFKYSLQKFVPRAELEEHILDIGGVGMILGDSTFGGADERRAAFLLERGDVYYQDHENYEEAALAYREAGRLHPCDQVHSRMVYLKRRYWEIASDPRDYQNLFHDYPPEWMEKMGPGKAVENAIVAKIMAGKLGSYLMMNWYVAPLPDSSAESRAAMDTALTLFQALHKMDPEEPLYTDSLASLLTRRGDLAGSESLYVELAGLYPFGSESALYRLAWTKLKLGKVGEIPALLARCQSFEEDARYLTMKGAVSMRNGHYRSAYASLARSLKVDKSIGETHALLADYYRHRGDKAGMQVHLNWQRRST
jgi:hypothetical protein